MKMTPEEMEKADWLQVSPCIWLCKATGKYHFSNETEMMDEDAFDTEAECRAALKRYLKFL